MRSKSIALYLVYFKDGTRMVTTSMKEALDYWYNNPGSTYHTAHIDFSSIRWTPETAKE